LDFKLKITYDPAANAVYVLVSKVQDVGTGETIVEDSGVIIDTDTGGNPRGYEFLTVRERGVPLAHMPSSVARALGDFVSSGALNSTVPVECDYES
jgi:uncharacterized protein YuzE